MPAKSPPSPDRRRVNNPMLIALAAAFFGHAAILPVVIPMRSASPPAEEDVDESDQPTPVAFASATSETGDLAAIALISEAELGAILQTRPGPFDSDRFGSTHPLANADADRSGTLAAHEGGEIVGGPFRETERRDHEDQRAEIWNGKTRAQVAVESTDDRAVATSPEAVTRAENPAFDSTTDRGKRARIGDAKPRPGDKEATGERDNDGVKVPKRDWSAADPLLDSMRAKARDAANRGRVTATSKGAISDRGTTQADVPRRGRLVGALDSAAASEETNPAPFELGRAGSSGDQFGVAGERGPGTATQGRGSGTASTTAAMTLGKAAEGVRASRADPYFRALYQALDRHVKFPRDLAKRLEQGTVVAQFTLNPDGKISSIRVAKRSGFKGFDDALLTALRKVKRFGKVPTRLIGDAKSLKVTAPYRFSNPLIR